MKHSRRVFLRNATLASGAIAIREFAGATEIPAAPASVSEMSASTSLGSSSIRSEFREPPRKYGPLVRWWWPGNYVSDAELRREIGLLAEAGFAGAEIQPFVKGFSLDRFTAQQREEMNSYATPSFFRHVGVATEEARQRGLFIDYTFGSGWPFGGGMDITPELASIELRSTHVSVVGPAHIHQKLHIPSRLAGSEVLKELPAGWAERMLNRTKVIAVVAARGEDTTWYFNQGPGRTVRRSGRLERNTVVDLTSRLQEDGTLSWDAPSGTWQIFVFCYVPTGERVNAGAGPGPQLVMDHLSSAAFAAHAQYVGNNAIPYIGQYFGNGLRAIFCDSLEVGGFLWADDFVEQFQQRRGYSIIPYLPVLETQSHQEPFGTFVEFPAFSMTEFDEQVRHDYRQTVSDLMTERMYEQFNRWAHDHNLLSRTQAHGSLTHVLRVYGEADIPETEDLYDDGCYDFLKMAASAAHVYGRPIVGSESFVWADAAYQTTPEKMKLAADELLTAGVNAILYHGFPYTMPGFARPGWHPFSGMYSGAYSSQLNELNTFWPYFGQLNSYITRVQYLSQTGKNIAALALYWNDLAHGAAEQPPSPKLNQALLDDGYNYDHMNAEMLLRSNVQGKMLTAQAGAQYRALVLPPLETINIKLAERLQRFAADGLPIFFAGRVPVRGEGFLNSSSEAQRIEAAMHGLRSFSNVYFASGTEDALSMLEKSIKRQIEFDGNPLPFIEKRIGRMAVFFLRNPSDATQHLHAGFDAEGTPELWDPWTGKVSIVADYGHRGQWTEIEMDLEPMASALLVFDPDRPEPPAPPNAPKLNLRRAEEIGVSGWKLTATGMMPSGKTEVLHRDLSTLIDWSLDSELRGFSGRGVYSTTFVLSGDDVSAQRLLLDLGNVKDVAEISVNGKRVSTLLLRPYQADIREYVRPGGNSLEVCVVNALFNAMVLRNPRTFRPGPTENPSGLMSAGLIGPVQLKVMD